jgi:hypothetical protein
MLPTPPARIGMAQTVSIPISVLKVPLSVMALRMYCLLARYLHRSGTSRLPSSAVLKPLLPGRPDNRGLRRARLELIDAGLMAEARGFGAGGRIQGIFYRLYAPLTAEVPGGWEDTDDAFADDVLDWEAEGEGGAERPPYPEKRETSGGGAPPPLWGALRPPPDAQKLSDGASSTTTTAEPVESALFGTASRSLELRFEPKPLQSLETLSTAANTLFVGGGAADGDLTQLRTQIAEFIGRYRAIPGIRRSPREGGRIANLVALYGPRAVDGALRRVEDSLGTAQRPLSYLAAVVRRIFEDEDDLTARAARILDDLRAQGGALRSPSYAQHAQPQRAKVSDGRRGQPRKELP